MKPRSARARLTIAYGLLVLVTGALLVIGSYVALRWMLTRDADDIRATVERQVDASSVDLDPTGTYLAPPPAGGAVPQDFVSYFQGGVIEEVLGRLAFLSLAKLGLFVGGSLVVAG